MKRRKITFFLAGLIAGLICATFWSFRSPEIAIMGLVWGVGPLFFVAVVAGIVISGAWRHFHPGLLRYLAGLVLCTTSYLAAVTAFWWVFGLSPRWIGFRPSDDMAQFGIDVWLGLVAAGAVGASGIASFSAILTGRWSKSLLLRLMQVGLVTIVVTYMVNLPFHSYWTFFGVLFPLGNALFCYLVGAEIWQRVELATRETVINTVFAE